MADTAAQPETMGFKEFAEHMGWKPGYVTELKGKGHLVLTADNRRVVVTESKALLADLRDPAKAGVAARHAATRAAAKASATTTPASGQEGDTGPDAGEQAEAEPAPDSPFARRRAEAQARREEALARKVERDELLELGQLLEREDVVASLAGHITILRTSLENMSADIAAELAATDSEDRCRQLIENALEHALETLSRRFAEIGREP